MANCEKLTIRTATAAPLTSAFRIVGLLLALGLLVACHSPTSKQNFRVTPLAVYDTGGKLDEHRSLKIVETTLGEIPNIHEFEQAMQKVQSLTGSPLYNDNHVTLLVDGPKTYDAMLQEISQAKSHIHLETYIFSSDIVGHRFRTVILERLRAGVEVKIIFDGVGSLNSEDEFFKKMKDAGAEVLAFHPVNPLDGGNPLELPFRDHRKLLIVDGITAFTGGINITEDYSSSSTDEKPKPPKDSKKDDETETGWRDTHVRINGPVVHEFERLFLETWNSQAEQKVADLTSYYGKQEKAGDHLVRVIGSDGGDLELSEVRQAYLYAMEAARKNIWITQAYFVPDPEFLEELKDAAKRGVDVRLLLPGISDSTMVLNATRAHYTDLLTAGVRIYETKDIILHAKTAVVDNVWSTVGSSNLDTLSFFMNHEVNATVLGSAFGNALAERFEKDLNYAREINLKEWKGRPFYVKFKQNFFKLLKFGL